MRTIPLWMFFALLLLAPFILTLLGQQADQQAQKARQAAEAGEWAQAAQYMANAAASQFGSGDRWEEAGRYALQAGDLAMAQTFLERAGFDRLSPQGLIALGDVQQQNGDLLQAVQSWMAALDRGEAVVHVYPRLFDAYQLGDDLSAGAAALSALADRFPEEARLQYQAGLLLAASQPELALPYLSHAARLDSLLAQRTDRIAQAILEAQRQTAPDETHEISPAYLFLASGRALAAADEWLLAKRAFQTATNLQPDYADAWAYLGEARTHSAVDDPLLGLADIQYALQLDPASLPAQLFLAYYWTRQQQYEQARQVIANAQAIYPQDALLYAEMGNILALSGDVQTAYLAYAQAIALAPGDPTYLNYLVRFSLTYNFELSLHALPLARQAVILAPNDSETLDLMAQVLLRLGDLANAERFVYRALQNQPDYAPAHLSLGTLYLLRNQLDLARQEFQMVLQLAPGSMYAEQANNLLETYFP